MKKIGQEKDVERSLAKAVQVFSACKSDYRIIGSTLIAAHVGRLFRKIGDLDIVLDRGSYRCVLSRLKADGFKVSEVRAFGFGWVEAKKKGHVAFTLLLVGRFTKRHFTFSVNRVVSVRVRSDYLAPTVYRFGSVSFLGIPLASAVAGIKASRLNPKRRLDREVLGDAMQLAPKRRFGNFTAVVLGVPIPFAYELFSLLHDLYGWVRTRRGLGYESW